MEPTASDESAMAVLDAGLDAEDIVAYEGRDVRLLAGLLRSSEASRALLDALDAVDRGAYEAVEDAAMDNRFRAEHAERERDVLRADNRLLRQKLERFGIHDDWCSAWPGRGGGCECGFSAALSADADAEPEPGPGGFHHDFGCTHDSCECSGEPSRAGAMDCGHDSINYSYVLGQCRACDVERVEPSPAEGEDGTHYVDDGCSGGHREDGGGDDGRSRADEAIVSAICDRFGGGTKPCGWCSTCRARAVLEGGSDGRA